VKKGQRGENLHRRGSVKERRKIWGGGREGVTAESEKRKECVAGGGKRYRKHREVLKKKRGKKGGRELRSFCKEGERGISIGRGGKGKY